jgi:hypothetical protein
MKKLYSNATVMWSEQEIIRREALINQIYQVLYATWRDMNRAVQFYRVETPIITPAEFLKGHTDEGFPMLQCERGYLRPEIAGGCFQAFFEMFPNEGQRKKNLPVVIWQAGKSFREETNPDTMRASKLRLVEFWQLEFELICSVDSKAEYMSAGIEAIWNYFNQTGDVKASDELPHYSIKTLDWHIDDLEVAGCSVRKDLDGYLVHEISIGLDRLLGVL